MLLTREAILAADDLKRELVEVPEWGGALYLRTLTAGERERWDTKYLGDKDKTRDNVQASLVALTAVDEAGNHLFTEADIVSLNGKSAQVLLRIAGKALEINRVGAQEMENLEKNSETTPGDVSPTA